MSSEGPPILDTKISSERLFTLTTGAETCESAAIGCLAVNTSTAADALSSAVIATVDCVSTAMRDVKAKAKVLCALRNKRLEWQLEEFAARQAGLEGFVRQLCVYSDASDLDAIEDSVKTAGQLLDEMDSLTAHSAALFACGSAIAVFAVSGMSHVQQCIDVVQSAVSHPEWLRRGEGHRVTIVCCDSHGDAVKRVSAKDVYVDFSDVTGWIVGDITAEDGTVSVSVTPSTESAQTVTAFITIDSAHFTIPLKVCRPV